MAQRSRRRLDVVAALTIFGGTGNNGPLGPLPLILGVTPVVAWFVAVSIVLLGGARSGQKFRRPESADTKLSH